MKSLNINYSPEIDHLRGMAAILIIYYHGVQLIGNKLIYNTAFSLDHWLTTDNPFLAVIIEGHSAVALFMVLSGFIFTKDSLDKEIIYRNFIFNRFLRTYPLFLFLMFVGIYSYPQNFRFSIFLHAFFGFSNIDSGAYFGNFAAMFWTIAVEWHFYLIFPCLLLFLNKKGLPYLAGLTVVMIVIRSLAYLDGANIRDISYLTILGRLDQFLFGMGLAVFYKQRVRSGAQWDGIFALSLGCVVALLFLFHKQGGWPTEPAWKILWPTLEGAVWALFILSYFSFSRHIPTCVSRVLLYLGSISYSLYLLHYFIIQVCIKHRLLMPFDSLNPLLNAFINTTIIVLPTVIGIASLTFIYIEQPFLDLRVAYRKS